MSGLRSLVAGSRMPFNGSSSGAVESSPPDLVAGSGRRLQVQYDLQNAKGKILRKPWLNPHLQCISKTCFKALGKGMICVGNPYTLNPRPPGSL